MRLDKLISECGIASRKEIRQMIKAGRVTVDGVVAVSPEQKLDPDFSVVALDGETVGYKRFHYYMINKPDGVLSATDDGKQRTVLDLLSPELRRMGLFPVGRLDKDTTGLLLLTDDGEFAHRVISPKSEVVKLYHAVTEGTVTEADIEAFRRGVVLGDGTLCLPAELEALEDGSCLVSVMEGKYHQVKRMLASRGKPVTKLERLSIGGLKLDKMLKYGEYRELTESELCSVLSKK
ncbi:MAG: rRNA pseudouridine synthase [Oscillospiraceae bacterium]|nr:rRNA pseudouridine synthase [Oscillospiraceae bacterium]